MYSVGTAPYVLNNLHIIFQELENGATLADAIDMVGYNSMDELYGAIEEVRDCEEQPQKDTCCNDSKQILYSESRLRVDNQMPPY